QHPRHPYTKGLLECIPRLDRARTPRLRSIEGGLPDPHQVPAGCPFAPRCPLVMERCWTEAPPLEEKVPHQLAACWAGLSSVDRASVAGPTVSLGRVSDGREANGRVPGGALVEVRALNAHFPRRPLLPLPVRRLLRAA